jgi:hypothetical protein
MNLEDDLRRALRRTDPPPDFANRVIAEIERSTPRAKVNGFPSPVPNTDGAVSKRFPALQWLAAAATLALSVAGGVRYFEYRQNVAEARRVEAEIQLAMQITNEALARVQAKLQETGR